MAKLIKTYKGFGYSCDSAESEQRLKEYIDSLGEAPTALPSVSQANYEAWHCDYDFAGVKLLVLPTTIRKIGKCVFAQSQLENLIADGVETIDELAFYNTQDLVSVRARSCKKLVSTDGGKETDGSDAFNHSSVRQLELPALEFAGRYAFYDMPNIEELSLPNVVRIEPHAIYNCENLRVIRLDSLRRAGFSTATMNKNLERVECPSLLEKDRLAFHSNGACRVNAPVGTYKTELVANKEPLPYDQDVKRQATARRTINYDFNYKGFCFNFSLSLTRNDIEQARRILESEIDEWVKSGEIGDSPSMGTNESGHEGLAFVRDIYVPARIRKIGDYAFAKCGELESVVAPTVQEVGDHAFYCDDAVSYVELPTCTVLKDDTFNGTGCDVPRQQNYSKIIIPKVRAIGRHAFWQTGFRVVEAPECTHIKRTAFEENEVLQRIAVKKLADHLCITNNPELREVVASSVELDGVLRGCPLANEIKADSSEPGED